MLGNIGNILQQLATALTTGIIPTSLLVIGIAVCAIMFVMGRMSILVLGVVILGGALFASAQTIATAVMGG